MMNELSLQRGKGLQLSNGYCLRHPTLSDIEILEEQEEDKYNQLLYALILNSKDVADVLWVETGVWYEDIKNEWNFFLQRALTNTIQTEVIMNFEGEDLLVSALAVQGTIKEALNYFLNMDGDFVFVQREIENSDEVQTMICKVTDGKVTNDSFKITEFYYNQIIDYLKQINWIKIEYDFLRGGTKSTKKYMLEHSYKARKKNKKPNINISTINSSLVAKGIQNTWDMPIYMFYDCYYRLVKIDDYKNTMSALYAGGIDTKKNPINWEKINWSSIINI